MEGQLVIGGLLNQFEINLLGLKQCRLQYNTNGTYPLHQATSHYQACCKSLQSLQDDTTADRGDILRMQRRLESEVPFLRRRQMPPPSRG